MTERGKFIVFEGLDGSGKSTQLALLEQRMTALGRRVFRTAEPTGRDTGKAIRRALSGAEMRSSSELAALFLADRIAHNEWTVMGEGTIPYPEIIRYLEETEEKA